MPVCGAGCTSLRYPTPGTAGDTRSGARRGSYPSLLPHSTLSVLPACSGIAGSVFLLGKNCPEHRHGLWAISSAWSEAVVCQNAESICPIRSLHVAQGYHASRSQQHWLLFYLQPTQRGAIWYGPAHGEPQLQLHPRGEVALYARTSLPGVGCCWELLVQG